MDFHFALRVFWCVSKILVLIKHVNWDLTVSLFYRQMLKFSIAYEYYMDDVVNIYYKQNIIYIYGKYILLWRLMQVELLIRQCDI